MVLKVERYMEKHTGLIDWS